MLGPQGSKHFVKDYSGTFTQHPDSEKSKFSVTVAPDRSSDRTVEQYFAAVEGLNPYGEPLRGALDASPGDLSAADSPSAAAADSDEDWDAMIDTFESCIDSVIICYKKASAGDPAAEAKYNDLLLRANLMTKKFEKAKDQLSSRQISRLTRLATEKLAAVDDLD